MVYINNNKKLLSALDFPEEQGPSVSELLAKLTLTLSDKTRLETECSLLKIECHELRQKLQTFRDIVHDERKLLMDEFRKSQYDLHEKGIHLMECNFSVLQEKQKYLNEIQQLQSAKRTLVQDAQQKQVQLLKKIEEQAFELSKTRKQLSVLQEEVLVARHKANKYKKNLRHALAILSQLSKNMYFEEFHNEQRDIACQTKTEQNLQSHSKVDIKPLSEIEDNVLSDLFFLNDPVEDIHTVLSFHEDCGYN